MGGGGRSWVVVVVVVEERSVRSPLLRPSRMTMCFDAPASAQTPDFQTSLCIPLASLGASLGLSTAIPSVYRSFTTKNTAVTLPGSLRKQVCQPSLPQAHLVSFSRLALLAKQVIRTMVSPSRQATCLRCASHCRAKPYTTAFLHRYHALGRAPCSDCMFHGLSRSAKTPIKYIRSVHLRNDRIVRLDAETVASFVSSHAKRDVELLSELSITGSCQAAVSRANTSNDNQGTELQSGKRSHHHCPSHIAQCQKGCTQARPMQAFRCFRP
jgi:hypothetical protein